MIFSAFAVLVGALFFFTPAVLAHEAEVAQAAPTFGEYLLQNEEKLATQTTLFATALVVILLILTALIKNETEMQKRLLFWPMVVAILLNTIFISGMTIYANTSSFTGGPVHWHAAFELYGCGKRIELIDPVGFSNKIGTPVLHEHNDNWIHLEGVPLKKSDAVLHEFLEVTNIKFTDEEFAVPTDDGVVSFKTGDKCDDEAGHPQAFLYTFKKVGAKLYEVTQRKFQNAEELHNYLIAPTGNLPGGDCIILEFDTHKDKTDKLCKVYEAAKGRGELKGI